MDHLDHLRRAFRDIIARHTSAPIFGRPAFIRHLCHADQTDIDTKREEFAATARAMGIDSDEQRLAKLRAEGKWTDQKERDLQRAKSYIGELEVGKRKAGMPSLVPGYVKRIDEAKADYEAKVRERRQLLGLTCEVYADHEVNDYYIVSNLFADSRLTEPLFAPNEFDYFTDAQMNTIVADYNKATEYCSDHNLKRLAMQGFFQRYFQLVNDDLKAFFGRPICDLTFYQLDLLRYGAHFRSIYQNHDVSTWKPEVLEDPDMLTDYALAVTKGKQDMAAQGANEPGTVVMGAKKEDAKVLGLNANDPTKQIMSQFGGNVIEWARKQAG